MFVWAQIDHTIADDHVDCRILQSSPVQKLDMAFNKGQIDPRIAKLLCTILLSMLLCNLEGNGCVRSGCYQNACLLEAA